MKLLVPERVTLLGILPEQGNFITLKIVRKLRESLAFDEEELTRLSIQQTDGVITWDASADVGKEITIGEKATDLIVDGLKKLDREEKLSSQHFNLYEKFMNVESD